MISYQEFAEQVSALTVNFCEASDGQVGAVVVASAMSLIGSVAEDLDDENKAALSESLRAMADSIDSGQLFNGSH